MGGPMHTFFRLVLQHIRLTVAQCSLAQKMSEFCVVIYHVSIVDTGHIFYDNLFCPGDLLIICSVIYLSMLALRDNSCFYADS